MVDRTRDAGTIADVQRRFPSRKFLPLGSLDWPISSCRQPAS